MDYGQPIQFAYFVLPDTTHPLQALERAVKADELGIDLIGIQDHLYQHRRVLNAGANLTARDFTTLALEYGFDTFVIGESPDDPDGLKRFLEEAAPRVRELVAAGRA